MKEDLVSPRLAVSGFFFVNGFLYANWTARLPEIQRSFGVSDAGLGNLLFVAAAGALLSMLFAGRLANRFGSDKITVFTAAAFCCFIPFLVISGNPLAAGFAFFAMGMSTGALDVAMNGQAVFVERRWQKPIMSSFHAIFSIGMAMGAGVGALFSKLGAGLFPHLFGISVGGLAACFAASFYLIKDELPTSGASENAEGGFRLPTAAILPLGIIAFCCMTGEGSMSDWGALYMHKVVGRDEAFSALAFGVFGTAMTLGRIFGDWLTKKLGKRNLLILNSVLALAGLGCALFFATTWATLAGFFLTGLGLATIVPIVYSSAGNMPGVSPGVGIAMAAGVGYAGFFVGPPAIGHLSTAFGLRAGLGFTLVLFMLMLFLVLRLPADTPKNLAKTPADNQN